MSANTKHQLLRNDPAARNATIPRMNDPLRYSQPRLTIDGVEYNVSKLDVVAFEKPEDAEAYTQLGQQIDEWNEEAER